MTTETKHADALQLIFSLFLGLLLVVFIGVGVWTFYPQPYGQGSPEQRQLNRLYQQQGGEMKGGSSGPTQTAEQARIQKQIDDLDQKMQTARDRWAVNTSITLLIFATLLMAISLFLPEHVKVFSNGVLLGGIFSIIYGTGWSFAGGDSRARFYVVLAALLLSVGIGYLRFIRNRQDAAEPAAAQAGAGRPSAGEAATADATLADLADRVTALERRTAAAADALQTRDDR